MGMFRDRFLASLALTRPIIFYSPMVQEWFGYTRPSSPARNGFAPVLGTVVVFGGVRSSGCTSGGEDRQPGMMLLIGMAITVAHLALATTLGWFDLDFWCGLGRNWSWVRLLRQS